MEIILNRTRLGLITVIVSLILFWLWSKGTFCNQSERIVYVESHRYQDQQSRVDWSDLFKFVPNGVRSCKELFRGETKFPADLDAKYAEYVHYIEGHVNVAEGTSGESREERRTLNELVRSSFVKTVCETGFNAGHSSFVYLESNPNVRVFSFDLGSHDYAHVMADHLQKQYPGRLTVTWGDSTKSIPEFQKKHPNVSCDMIFIDGGHSTQVCLADFYNFRKMAAPDHVLILDNYPERRFRFHVTIGNCWEQVKRLGHVREIFNCNHDPAGLSALGFTVAQYDLS